MKMRSIVAPTIVAAVLISIPVSVLGQQSPGMMGPGARSMMGPGMMRGQGQNGSGDMMGMTGSCPMMGGATGEQARTFAEERIAFLKTELSITDAQKNVWDAYADAIRHNLQSMQGMRQMMKAVFEAKTPIERLDAHIATMESRVAALKEVKPALANLYAALSSEQKQKADELLTGMGCMI